MGGLFLWISECVLAIVNRPMELHWPNSGGCSHRNRASSRCLQRAGAFFLSIAKEQRDLFSRCRLVL